MARHGTRQTLLTRTLIYNNLKFYEQGLKTIKYVFDGFAQLW